MHGENPLVNNRSNRKAVKAISKGLPKLDVISSLALVVEAINAVDAGRFVIAAQEKEIFRVFDLVG